MRVEIIDPHGFCRGVAAAIHLVEKTLEGTVPKGVYCLHELVHNELVTSRLQEKGLVFVERVNEVPEGATVIFSAHGVSPEVRELAAARQLEVVDATCPFVRWVHEAVRRFAEGGMAVVVIGHREHVEVQGVLGEAREAGGEAYAVMSPDEVAALPLASGTKVGVVAQTTLAASDITSVMATLRKRFPDLECSATACSATNDRQRAVMDFVESGGDGVLVLGGTASSNTRRLGEVAARAGAGFVKCVSSLAEIDRMNFAGVKRLGLTSGASTPEDFLISVVRKLETV